MKKPRKKPAKKKSKKPTKCSHCLEESDSLCKKDGEWVCGECIETEANEQAMRDLEYEESLWN